MRAIATKQPNNESAKQKKNGEKGRSHSISPLSTGMPLLQRQCACGGGCPRCKQELGIQTKLKISEPGDRYEQEADRIADEVMRMPRPSVQRQVEPEEAEEERVQRKAIASKITPLVKRQADFLEEEEEEIIQPKHSSSQVTIAIPAIEAGIQSLWQNSGQPLSADLRAFMEPRFGRNFSNIRIHTGSQAEQLSRSLNAGAFTIGNDIILRTRQFNPESNSGKKLLAHELTHTIQQGPVQNVRSTFGGVIQRGDPEESAQPSVENQEDRDFVKELFNLPLQEAGIVIVAKLLNLPLQETYIVTIEIIEAAERAFIVLVEKIRKKKGNSIDVLDEMALKAILSLLPISHIKKLEKELLLWPKFGQIEKMTRIIEITADFTRKTDFEESKRGQFPENQGSEIKDKLSQATENFGFNECLNFLYKASLSELYSDEEKEVETAKSRYAKGAAERGKKTTTHAKTLSRLASELRLQGLTGPVNILKWKGKGEKGHHEPHPADLFDRLSSGGDGWYFFLVNLISFHTFIIAVNVSSGGSNRRYFEIQGGQSLPKSREELKAWFDDEFSNEKGAYSRVWQVYLQPTD
ncbi:MAG: DUF4157 domain-containing protein [Microcoleus sp.]